MRFSSVIRLAGLGIFGVLGVSDAALAQTAPADAPPAVLMGPPSPKGGRLQLALIGTILGKSEGIAFFVKEPTGAIVLLKPGQGHAGWTLRSIKTHEVVLQNDSEIVRLGLQARSADRASASLSPALAEGQRVPTAFRAPPNFVPSLIPRTIGSLPCPEWAKLTSRRSYQCLPFRVKESLLGRIGGGNVGLGGQTHRLQTVCDIVAKGLREERKRSRV